MYRKSDYNFFIPIHEYNVCLIYNSLSNGLYEIDIEKGTFLESLKICDIHVLKSVLDESEISQLISAGILIGEDVSEMQIIDKRFEIARNLRNSNGINLTILPTYECNLRCPYCFEGSKPRGKMSEMVMDKIIELCKNITERENTNKKLSITWYGGEPLLYPELLDLLSKKFQTFADDYQLEYKAVSIITNGLNLTPEVCDILLKNDINKIQVTIDGDKNIHNQSRIVKDSSINCYETILNNIVNSPDDLKFIIRINADQKVIKVVKNLLDDLDRLKLWPHKREKVKLSLAYKRPYKNNPACKNDCLGQAEYYEEELIFQDLKREVINKWIGKENKIPFRFPGLSPFICTTTHNLFGLVIDKDGNLYKCWEDVAMVERQIGNIIEDYDELREKFFDNDMINFNRIHFDKECESCKFLPVCTNSCPVRFVNKNNYKICSPWKFSLIKTLHDQYIQIKESADKIYEFKTPYEVYKEKGLKTMY